MNLIRPESELARMGIQAVKSSYTQNRRRRRICPNWNCPKRGCWNFRGAILYWNFLWYML